MVEFGMILNCCRPVTGTVEHAVMRIARMKSTVGTWRDFMANSFWMATGGLIKTSPSVPSTIKTSPFFTLWDIFRSPITAGIFSDGENIHTITFKRTLAPGGFSQQVELIEDETISKFPEGVARALDFKKAFNRHWEYSIF